MDFSLTNNQLSITVSSIGAELISVKSIVSGFEFMWQRDPKYWARTSPVLFPIVGKTKDNQLRYNSINYPMSQHGFARDCEFTMNQINATTIHCKLASSKDTLAIYPFFFELEITYQLIDNELHNSWKIKNTDKQNMYFSIGAHPAFRLIDGKMHEYDLVFSMEEIPQRYLLQQGLFNGETKSIPFIQNRLNLNTDLFNDDAIVMESIQSKEVILKHKDTAHQVSMRFGDIPFLGIWAPKACTQFVCIEPWYGLSDSISGHNDVSAKKGMILLEPFNSWEKSYSMGFIS